MRRSTQTDFDEINDLAHKKGFADICVNSDIDIALQADLMHQCFGDDWMMDLPTRDSNDYRWLNKIVNAIKAAFQDEIGRRVVEKML